MLLWTLSCIFTSYKEINPERNNLYRRDIHIDCFLLTDKHQELNETPPGERRETNGPKLMVEQYFRCMFKGHFEEEAEVIKGTEYNKVASLNLQND